LWKILQLVKIILDPQIFQQQKYGGISRYYIEIFSIISKKKDVEIILPTYPTSNVYLNKNTLLNKSLGKVNLLIRILNFFGISTRTKIKKQNRKLFIRAMKQDYDLFIPTYYNTYFLNSLGSKPFVLTVYDMIHELFPQYFEESDTTAKDKLVLMEKASKIIAVSQNTKNDIIKIYPHIDAAKIEVIYHGNSINIESSSKVDLPSNYILFVGTRSFYKNFTFLINSITELLKKDPSLHVVCAGGGEFIEEEKNHIKSLGFEKQIIHKTFEENELGQFYQKAKCFVFPSMYEGFGIPVLESMACGCPVILGNHSSFPEVAGDAGVYFDINKSEDLMEKVNFILKDENARKEFILKGYKQVSKFDWEVAAEQCLKLYKKSI
jgi:glycosyltransferase involved in cell wall biosynthesis